jgi:hypothetical protein
VEAPEYKVCSQCCLEKPIEDFSFDNKGLNQRRANCKECKNAASKRAYEGSRDDPESVARRIIRKCKEREKFRLAKFVKRRDKLDSLPDVELAKEQFDLDVEWVLEQKELQQNQCFYTGLAMVWSTGLIDENKRINPQAITIERINNNIGYVKNNCILVCWRANCFRGDGTIMEMLDFAREINNRAQIIKIGLNGKK